MDKEVLSLRVGEQEWENILSEMEKVNGVAVIKTKEYDRAVHMNSGQVVLHKAKGSDEAKIMRIIHNYLLGEDVTPNVGRLVLKRSVLQKDKLFEKLDRMSVPVDVLITCLIEELAETIYALTKIQRFGLEGGRAGSSQNNKEVLNVEWIDVLAVAEMLEEVGVLDLEDLNVEKEKKNKKRKVKFFYWKNLALSNREEREEFCNKGEELFD